MDIPAIFTQDEWQNLQRAIKGTPRPQRRNTVYALTGRGRVHLRCSCGSNLSGLKDVGKEYHQYQCSHSDVTFGEDRCPHRPYRVAGPALEGAVIDQFRSVLTEDYLLDLARDHVGRNSDPRTARGDAEALRRRLVALENQAENIMLNFAESSHADTAMRALNKIKQQQDEVGRKLAEFVRQAEFRVEWASVEEHVRSLVSTAAERLANPTSEELAELADLLELDLVRVADQRYEGTASIPLLPGEPPKATMQMPSSSSEVYADAPRRD